MDNKDHDLLLPLTKDELITLWRNCQLATEKLVTRTDGWGMLCYKKAELIKKKISNTLLEIDHKEYCQHEIKRVYGDKFAYCDFLTETPYKSKDNNIIYAYRVSYKENNELKSCLCEVEIIPVTTDEYGEELKDDEDIDYMYEIIKREGELNEVN